MDKEKKVDENKEEETPKEKMREIIILTDGNEIKLEKAEVSGAIELVAILQNIIGALTKKK